MVSELMLYICTLCASISKCLPRVAICNGRMFKSSLGVARDDMMCCAHDGMIVLKHAHHGLLCIAQNTFTCPAAESVFLGGHETMLGMYSGGRAPYVLGSSRPDLVCK